MQRYSFTNLLTYKFRHDAFSLEMGRNSKTLSANFRILIAQNGTFTNLLTSNLASVYTCSIFPFVISVLNEITRAVSVFTNLLTISNYTSQILSPKFTNLLT